MALKIGDFVDFVPHTLSLASAPPQVWYLLRINPSKLSKVLRAFELYGVTSYVPMLTKTIVRRGRKIEMQEPLFVGIVFVADFDVWRRWREFDGVIDLLRFGEWTASLPELRRVESQACMMDVRLMVASAGLSAPKLDRAFQVGSQVRIVDGPFAGFQGRIDRLDSKGRLRVLLAAVKRGQLVDIADSQIEAVSPDVGVRRMSRQSRDPQRKAEPRRRSPS